MNSWMNFPLVRFLDGLWNVQWWLNNIGQLFGAAFGAGLAYFIGAYQTRQQIELSQLPEKIKQAKHELPFLNQLQNKLNDILRKMDVNTEFGSLDEFRNEDHLTLELKEEKEVWWERLSDPNLAMALNKLHGELWHCERRVKRYLEADIYKFEFMEKVIEDKWYRVLEVNDLLVAAEEKCRKLLGIPIEKRSLLGKIGGNFYMAWEHLKAKFRSEDKAE